MSAEPAAAEHPDSKRLQKLWEAYRVQEEEYKEAVSRLERVTRDLEDRDASMAQRERDLQAHEMELSGLRKQLEERDARIAELEKDIAAVDAYKDRVAELEAAYAQEKERLAKLYLLYEESLAQKSE